MKAVENYCSKHALQNQEPLLGSAPSAPTHIYLSWPKNAWGRRALEAKGIPSEWKPWLETQQSKHGKVGFRLMSRPGWDASSLSLLIYPAKLYYQDLQLDDILPLLESYFSGSPKAPSSEMPPHFFVCTHGRYDKCCAKYGQAFFEQACQQASQYFPKLQVWESSHLGGHRFAATALFLPSGDMYGHLTAEHLPELLQTAQQQQIYHPQYRGRIGFNSQQQLWLASIDEHVLSKQEALLKQPATLDQILDLQSVQLKMIDSCTSEVELDLSLQGSEPPSRLRVQCSEKTFVGPASCTDEEPFSLRKRWMIDEVSYVR